MKKLLFISLMVLGYGIAKAQTQENVLRLNTVNSPESFSAKASGYTFTLNESIFTDPDFRKGSLLEVDTESGIKLFSIDRITEFIPGSISVSASTEEGEQFSFTYFEGRMSGLYHEADHSRKLFEYDNKAKVHQITRDLPEELTCDQELDPSEFESFVTQKGKAASGAVVQSGNDITVNTTIDVIAVYTQEAFNWAFLGSPLGSAEAHIAQAFNLSQTAMDNSGIPVTFRVVHIYQTDYEKPAGTPTGDLLRIFTASPSFDPFGTEAGLDEIHVLRDEYGADVLALFDQVSDTGGIAWVLTNRGGSPQFAFNVNRIQQVTTGYTLVHEIGHNMGNFHSRTQQTQTAPARGGVFHESVGFQDFVDSVHTIMAYSEGLSQIPVFSNPDLVWGGTTAGVNSSLTPTNAALSLSKIKNTIASYRPTKTDAPAGNVSSNQVMATLATDQELTATLSIGNTGASDLNYNLDFELLGILQPEIPDTAELNALNQEIYNSGFEGNEGYNIAPAYAMNGWRIYSGADAQFSITSANPSAGGRSIRLTGNGSGSPQFLYSPYVPGVTFGSYDVSFDFSMADSTGEKAEFYLLDTRGRTTSSGVTVENGKFGFTTKQETGFTDTQMTDIDINTNQYYRVDIEYDSQDEVIRYYLDSLEVGQTSFSTAGNAPAEMVAIFSSAEEGSTLDIDRFSITQKAKPFPWVSVDEVFGTVPPDSTAIVELDFNATGLPAGVYEGNLVVYTNQATFERADIALSMTVTGPLSSESEENVEDFRLMQNYPNPFNPATTISYVLNEAADVKLEVFDIQGRKVALLEDTKKQSGSYTITFNASELASGMYIYRLTSNGKSLSKRMLLLK